MKDAADLCAYLEPLGHDRAHALLRFRLYGEPDELTGAEQTIIEYDRAQHEADLRALRPFLNAARVAMWIARDLETCRDLLAGLPVDPDRLDQQELLNAKNRRLVRLDMTALDHFTDE